MAEFKDGFGNKRNSPSFCLYCQTVHHTFSFRTAGDGFPVPQEAKPTPTQFRNLLLQCFKFLCHSELETPAWESLFPVSFRGAKRRGNLLAQFHLLGKPVIEVTAYYEIATPLAGLAMTQWLPFRGKRSAVAEVNDSPVDCQSRNRARRSEQARLPSVTEGLISVPNPSEQNQRFCPPPLKGRLLANKSGARGWNLLPRWGFIRIENQGH